MAPPKALSGVIFSGVQNPIRINCEERQLRQGRPFEVPLPPPGQVQPIVFDNSEYCFTGWIGENFEELVSQFDIQLVPPANGMAGPNLGLWSPERYDLKLEGPEKWRTKVVDDGDESTLVFLGLNDRVNFPNHRARKITFFPDENVFPNNEGVQVFYLKTQPDYGPHRTELGFVEWRPLEKYAEGLKQRRDRVSPHTKSYEVMLPVIFVEDHRRLTIKGAKGKAVTIRLKKPHEGDGVQRSEAVQKQVREGAAGPAISLSSKQPFLVMNEVVGYHFRNRNFVLGDCYFRAIDAGKLSQSKPKEEDWVLQVIPTDNNQEFLIGTLAVSQL